MKDSTCNGIAIFVLMLLSVSCNSGAEKERTTPAYGAGVVAGKKVERYGMITGLKRGKTAYYKELHAAVWPGVLKKIKECNIQNYSIYLREMEGKAYLFSYFEYTGNDFDADMQKMAADTTTQRWWKETGATQIPLPDAAAKKQTWSRMEEVFFQQ